jgi:hypothetical protein
MSSTIDHASAAFSTPPVDDFSVAITSILMPSQSFTQGKQQQQQQASTALPLLSIILSALFLIEDVFILFFNVFAAITIIRHRQLQTRTNMAVLNLLIFDLLIGVFIPFHTAFFIYPSLATNHYACVIRIAINHAVCIATTISLIIVTADRYMAVVHPYRYSQYGAIPYLRAILVLLCFYSLGYLVSVVVFSHWPAPCNPEALLPPGE